MNAKKILRKVKVKHGSSCQVAKLFHVHKKTVSFAVNGKSDTDLAKKIRKAAMEMGGDPIYNV